MVECQVKRITNTIIIRLDETYSIAGSCNSIEPIQIILKSILQDK